MRRESDVTGPCLVLQSESGEVSFILVAERVTTIGRSRSCEICLEDDAASRRHASVYLDGRGEARIVDEGSHNGTIVNGQPIRIPRVLKDGDLVRIGQSILWFRHVSVPGRGPIESFDQSATSSIADHELVTVLVIDIRGYTGLARRLGEQTVTDLMRRWYESVSHVIQTQQSSVDQFTGDGLLASWIHAGTVCQPSVLGRACTAMRLIFEGSRGVHLPGDLGRGLRLGAGLSTGLAMVCRRGNQEKADFGVVGETVNHAFRLESATASNDVEVIIDSETYALLEGAFGKGGFREAALTLKGYSEPVQAFLGGIHQLPSSATEGSN